jgi:thiol-disulfide isomerase/thioredoxin
MKAYLRLPVGLCPDRGRSAISRQQSVLDSWPEAVPNLIPKIYHLIPLLILVFVSCGAVLAQEPVGHTAPAAKAETEIAPLKVGDKIPDELWDLPLQVVNHPEGKEIITLNDYRGKLIILDFWATWCAPCISSLHKLDTLQEQFSEDLMVIPTSYETDDKILSFLSDREINLPSLIEETELKEYFPHKSIPHQVWLKDGNILAITGPEYANAKNIVKVAKGEAIEMRIKNEDFHFDKQRPLLIDGNGGGVDKLLYQSIISKRIDARIGGVTRRSNHLLSYNLTLPGLYLEAFKNDIPYSGRVNRVIFEISNDELKHRVKGPERHGSLNFESDQNIEVWASDNTYCYSLKFPNNTSKEYMHTIMQNDLNAFFRNYLGVEAKIESRPVECYVLKENGKTSLPVTKGGTPISSLKDNGFILRNDRFSSLVANFISANWMQKEPIVDLTGCSDLTDIDINVNLKDIPGVGLALNPYGFTIEKEILNIDMLVIKEIEL